MKSKMSVICASAMYAYCKRNARNWQSNNIQSEIKQMPPCALHSVHWLHSLFIACEQQPSGNCFIWNAFLNYFSKQYVRGKHTHTRRLSFVRLLLPEWFCLVRMRWTKRCHLDGSCGISWNFSFAQNLFAVVWMQS